jgi:hypothetical protein
MLRVAVAVRFLLVASELRDMAPHKTATPDGHCCEILNEVCNRVRDTSLELRVSQQ